ncbi:MAG: hypothetical protein KAR32_12130, partial [Candidatus Omnitrophica bacterium]|nr:hypothetical protein [Candidatus Omnitrophota bacterium]
MEMYEVDEPVEPGAVFASNIRFKNNIPILVTAIPDEAGVKDSYAKVFDQGNLPEGTNTDDVEDVKRGIRTVESNEQAERYGVGEKHKNLDLAIPFTQEVFSEDGALISNESLIAEPTDEQQTKVDELVKNNPVDYYMMVFPFSNHPHHRAVTQMFIRAIAKYNSTADIYFWADKREATQNKIVPNTFYVYGQGMDNWKRLMINNVHKSQNTRKENYEHYADMAEQMALYYLDVLRGHRPGTGDFMWKPHAEAFMKVNLKVHPESQEGRDVMARRARTQRADAKTAVKATATEAAVAGSLTSEDLIYAQDALTLYDTAVPENVGTINDHARRVTGLVALLGNRMKLSSERLRTAYRVASLHDLEGNGVNSEIYFALDRFMQEHGPYWRNYPDVSIEGQERELVENLVMGWLDERGFFDIHNYDRAAVREHIWHVATDAESVRIAQDGGLVVSKLEELLVRYHDPEVVSSLDIEAIYRIFRSENLQPYQLYPLLADARELLGILVAADVIESSNNRARGGLWYGRENETIEGMTRCLIGHVERGIIAPGIAAEVLAMVRESDPDLMLIVGEARGIKGKWNWNAQDRDFIDNRMPEALKQASLLSKIAS